MTAADRKLKLNELVTKQFEEIQDGLDFLKSVTRKTFNYWLIHISTRIVFISLDGPHGNTWETLSI